jgi:hypothetical protein
MWSSIASIGHLVRIALSVFLAILCGGLWRIANPSVRKLHLVLLVLISAIAFYGGLASLRLMSSGQVTVIIDEPASRTVSRNRRLLVRGAVSPATARVQLFVHPWNSNRWWVQETPAVVGIEGDSATWETQVFLGTEDQSFNETYEIVAVGSDDSLLFDLLAERYFRPGDQLSSLPLLSRSQTLIISREKQ